jgi:hypothetical protein
MLPEPSPGIAPPLNGLNEKLLRTLIDGARKFALVAACPMTVEIYLAALFQSFPGEVGSFFSEKEALTQEAEVTSVLSRLHPLGILAIHQNC